MITTPEFLNEFDDDITASESIPYCQVQNPKNLSLSEIRQYKVPWGIFVPTDQAELVELATLDYFTPTRLIFDQDTHNKGKSTVSLLSISALSSFIVLLPLKCKRK